MSTLPKSSVLAAIAAVPSRVEEASPLEVEVIELFDQLRDRLLRYLFSFNLPVADCEEVVQETFLALFQHLQKGKSRHNLRGWLFRVAHNLALKRHLRGRRDFQTLADLPAEIQVADPSPGPEAEFVEGEKRRRLQSVYHALPKQDQHCLALRAEGLRYREIADVLEISLGSVAISLERSLARLTRAADQMSFNRNIGESHAK